jgi:hypothetical protein
MKALTIAALSLFIACSLATPAMAAWSSCIGCHNGIIAPGKDALKERHKTLEQFVKAALESKNSMMNSIKKNENLIRETAKEIGLQ